MGGLNEFGALESTLVKLAGKTSACTRLLKLNNIKHNKYTDNLKPELFTIKHPKHNNPYVNLYRDPRWTDNLKQ
ncbi:hypothetical protein GCM10022246_06970 [Pedobacter ginsengiterrae]|uniref:Uncharacterized protein n=1 Tax=Pedobacter ginsengiterrae TaxID=871696 RepID=A0ABP7NWC5_9SPHI